MIRNLLLRDTRYKTCYYTILLQRYIVILKRYKNLGCQQELQYDMLLNYMVNETTCLNPIYINLLVSKYVTGN
jgi:hypothetical protein